MEAEKSIGKEFLGQGLKFPLQVDPRTGKIAMVSAEDDIREAIGIILGTMQGERVMRPDFGSNVFEYTFSAASSTVQEAIADQVRDQLARQELRIEDVSVTCREADGTTGTIIVEVGYTVRSTNNRYNHVYPFYVTEGSKGGDAE